MAFSADLGITPVDPEVAAICRAAAERFTEMGVIVEEAHPDLSEAHDAFQVLRGMTFAVSYAGLLQNHRDKMKPEVIWNIEQGLNYSMADVVRAENQRATLFRRMNAFFDTYDLLLCPATIVAAYPADERYVSQCAGHTLLELCRVAGDCLRDHPDSVTGPQPALWFYPRRTPRWFADCRSSRVRRDASWLEHAPLRTFLDCVASRRLIHEHHYDRTSLT